MGSSQAFSRKGELILEELDLRCHGGMQVRTKEPSFIANTFCANSIINYSCLSGLRYGEPLGMQST